MNEGLTEAVRHGLSVKYFVAGSMFGFGVTIAVQPQMGTGLERYSVAALVAAIGVLGWFYVRAEESEHRKDAIGGEPDR